jgi:type I restriction enzyme M protein
LIEGPAIIVGRKGSAGEVVFCDKPCFPIDTTYYIKTNKNIQIDFKFLFFILKSLRLIELKGGGAVPGLNRNDVYATRKIPHPSIDVQKQIVARIEEEQKMVDANKKLIELFEGKIKEKIAEVWG